MRVSWNSTRFPLLFQLNAKALNATPNVEPGSDVLGAIRSAMISWQEIPSASIKFSDIQTTSVESSSTEDTINLITMADTPVNRALLGGDKDTGTLALTRLSFNPATGEILESDILFNPRYRFSTNLAPGTYDLQSVATHELGHALGCDHAVAQHDTMFYQTREGEFFQRYLSVDSIGFAAATYPSAAYWRSMNVLSGKVTQDGRGIFGASVTAVEMDRNLTYTGLSEPDGSYIITGPVSGNYQVYVEPLDGPAKADQFIGSGSPDAYFQNINTGFRTAFLDVSRISFPASVGRQDGQAHREINLDVPSKPATVNINRMGKGDALTGSGYLSAGAVVVNQGDTWTLFIAGPETWKAKSVEDIRILGSGITIDSARGLRTIKNVSGTEVGISVLIRVSEDASPGSRTILLRVGDEQVACTGGLIIAPAAPPVLTLYFPYLEFFPLQYTGIAVANPTTRPSAIRLTGRGPQGALIFGSDSVIPANIGLGAGKQTARMIPQLFNLSPEIQQSGSLTVETDNYGLQGFFLTGDLAGKYLDGAGAFARPYKELCFLDILQNPVTTTEIHVMNVKNYPVDVQLLLLGATGLQIAWPVSVTIPALGKISDSVAKLFGVWGAISSAHIRVLASDEAIVGFGMIRQNDTIFGLNAQPAENASQLLYSPHMAVGNFGVHYATRLNIVNLGDASAEIDIALMTESGNLINNSRARSPISVMPGGQVSLDLQSFFGLGEATPIQGSIQVSGSPGSRLLANILFGDGNPTQMPLGFGAALALSASGDCGILFSQVSQSQGYYTGLACLAPEGAEVTIEVYSQNGNLTGSRRILLNAGARIVSLLQDLMPSTRDQVGGYIKMLASKPVIAFELLGATNGQFLSAVPPQRLNN